PFAALSGCATKPPIRSRVPRDASHSRIRVRRCDYSSPMRSSIRRLSIGTRLMNRRTEPDRLRPPERRHFAVAIGGLIISCGDGAVDLEVAEHPLDTVALPVKPLVVADHLGAV